MAINPDLSVVDRYIDAWNRHDVEAIVASFADGGTYSDPLCPAGLSGKGIAEAAAGLFEGFPGVTFEPIGGRATAESLEAVAFQWRMRGTNSGPFQGNPPTGEHVDLPGADFLVLEGDRIRSVHGYWDQKTFVEQLGLQALVLPRRVGPVSFGYAVRMSSGKATKPGAFSITWLNTRSEQEEVAVSNFSLEKIMPELAQLPGFLGFTGGVVEGWMYTVTAWESPDDAAQMMKSVSSHVEGMKWFFKRGAEGVAAQGFTSVWTPHHANALWVRCPSCSRMIDKDQQSRTCDACGADLPPPSPYW